MTTSHCSLRLGGPRAAFTPFSLPSYPGDPFVRYARPAMPAITKSSLPSPTLPAGAWFGIKYGDRGTHTSRTMMFEELAELMKYVAPAATFVAYRAAVIDDNILGKKTLATRKLSVQRLSELYGLDPGIPIFRVLRTLWDADRGGRRLLALLVAYARDPLLRLTVDAVLTADSGQPVPTALLDGALESRLGLRLNPSVRNKVARNAASSWTQGGHLLGRGSKRRSKAVATPGTACLALLLGYVSGLRGRSLLGSEWVRLLDTTFSELNALVTTAHRMNLLNFRQVGDVIEVRFPTLLLPYEEALCHG
jgi:hypothetical protein